MSPPFRDTCDPFLDQIAAKILRNLPTLSFPNGKEIKMISLESAWCLTQLQIPHVHNFSELQHKCQEAPQPKTLFFLNEKNIKPHKLFQLLNPNIPKTLFIPHPFEI